MLGIDRLGLLGPAVRASASPTGIDLPGEVAGIVPTNEWKHARSARRSSPARSTRPASARATTRCTPLQLLNAYAALANGGTLYQPQLVREIVDRDGDVVEPFKPEVLRELDIDPDVAAHDAARRAGDASRSATPTTSSTCPSWWPASPAPPSSALRTHAVACRSTPGSSGFTPKDP